MSSRIFPMPETLDWKQAYMSAILEKDRTRIKSLIESAQAKLSARLYELKAHDASLSDEVEAIHDATYLLQALHNSLAYRDDCAAAVPAQN